MPVEPSPSVNFGFLAEHAPALVAYGAEAEGLFRAHPRSCVATLRTLGEALARHAAAYAGIFGDSREEFGVLISRLRDRGVADGQVAAMFHALRTAGNSAVHAAQPGAPHTVTHAEALRLLRLARELAVWFHRSFADARFKAGPFVPPPDPTEETASPSEAVEAPLSEELALLRAEVTRLAEVNASAAQQAALRADAEARAAAAYADVEAAIALVNEATATLDAQKAAFEARLATVQAAAAAAPPEAAATVVQRAQSASAAVDLDERATRALIDDQLRAAGWEVDTSTLRFARGTRPAKGRNLAIAEWPTASGPCDYALFAGLVLVGVVEAKKQAVNVMEHLGQAARYSRGIRLPPDLDPAATWAGGPWGEHRVPFTFSANGRPFLRQMLERSGIWFRDMRRPQNPSTALEGWKTPEGLLDALKRDVDAAETALQAEPTHYLDLRDYQIKAIRAVEAAIAEGDRELLVAMATGTGKTRTAVGLIYRLIKAGRFQRVLFLVDRTSLGEQAFEAFEHTKLEQLQSFTEIYEVKELGDLEPEATTRLQFATVQGMVRRLFTADAGGRPLPVDTYDCIVVDESHRGYHLDRDLSEVELGFRSEADYISKYRRGLDHFDAVKVGLTATPALHTVDIFGQPVFVYSYREAVIDGFLVDHEPPFVIDTRLSREGITVAGGTEARGYDRYTNQETLFRLPDTVEFDVEDFNRQVITEPFNAAVVSKLVEEIDPLGDGKTLIFCLDNAHADMVVRLLREAYRAKYGDDFTDDLVRKITGSVDRPLQAIKDFKTEREPNIAVTVDLLTTGVDVPKIVNLVFLRRVGSRILFDQMRGRATRLCPEIGKEAFRIYDAVGLVEALKDYSDMKPVVENPGLSFQHLVGELTTATRAEERELVKEQLIAKLQRKKHRITGERLEAFCLLAGDDPKAVIEALKAGSPADAAAFFAAHPGLAAWLDAKVPSHGVVLVSDEPDGDVEMEQDFAGKTPSDYLQGFQAWLAANANALPALRVVTQRPRELTRAQLKELRLALDGAGYGERALSAAWEKKTNQQIAASIIGFVRQQALGDPLLPYATRVDRALQRLLGRGGWTRPQRDWLEKIASQMRLELVVDRDALNLGAFKTKGGYTRIDKEFNGTLATVLEELHAALWEEAG